MLCEGGFVDDWSDAEFVKKNYKKLAKAYADGIAKTLGISKPATAPKPSNKVLDKSGYKKSDKTIGSLALKELLLTAKAKGIIKSGMDENRVVGNGTINAINECLKKWGYKQTGVAGENFIKRLAQEIRKK